MLQYLASVLSYYYLQSLDALGVHVLYPVAQSFSYIIMYDKVVEGDWCHMKVEK